MQHYENHYNIRQRRSDETLREDGRHRALINAASEGQTPRVKHLLHLGAEIDHADEYGLTALHHAALSGFHDTVCALLEAGADVNADSLECGTPLHLAALKGRSHVVRLLLDARADVSRRSRMVGTPLHCACYAGELDIVDDLSRAGANVIAMDIVQPPLLQSIRTRGSFAPHDGPSLSRFVPGSKLLQCCPWHMGSLGANDSCLLSSALKPRDSDSLLGAWMINIVQQDSSAMASIQRMERFNVLQHLVEWDRPSTLHTLLVDRSPALTVYNGTGMGYPALATGVTLERYDCVRMLLRFRGRLDIDDTNLEKLSRIAPSPRMGTYLRDPRTSAPVYPKTHREYMSLKVLKYYDLPWEYDRDDPNYLIILRDMTEHELEVLFEATRKLRSGEWNPRRRGGPFPPNR
ncbi:Ankyrin repeat domain-containing protein 2 [Pseudocercospora fuligena]|uniref:Ankyrin repeat domain-containing protein 2 n=1 Tax=Pseudocercospora fuligena TaxID=685502 RepID=A0A8H6RDG8_9PEZI|nr:Ankyrin repeat domain-containing protein 2 [Pseudocercospora fuligena]